MVVGRMPWAVISVIAAAAVAGLAGCNSVTTAPGTTTIDTIGVFAPYSGTMTYTLGVTNFYAATEIGVGDLDATNPNVTERGIVSFYVQTLEGDTDVQSAVLRLDECFVSGAPFSSLGDSILLERLLPPGLPPAGYQYTGIADKGFGPITTSPDTGYVYDTVTSAVAADLADSAVFSQFRLRFSVRDGNNNGISDFVDFNGGPQAQPGNCAPTLAGQPVLIINYKTN
jgi:hypothetical protein